MNLEQYVKEMREDIKEMDKKIDSLLVFMAVEQDKAKRSAMVAGGTISLIVSILVIVAQKVLA